MLIGDVTLHNRVFLAPLAGVTDRSFRLLCRRYGCGLAFSEMVSVKSIIYGNAEAKHLLDTCEEEKPWAIQLFGHEPPVFAEAVKRLENDLGRPFDIVDINMGCPVPKVVKNGDGCALMNDPLLAGRIVESVARASGRPVTVKMRKGIGQNASGSPYACAVALARVVQESGASAVTVHGRTREQFYAGEADWDCVAHVKAAVTIPVIGNGDIFTPEAAVKRLTETGCDGIMVARGALGNPWLFQQIGHWLKTGEKLEPPSWEERIQTALAHTRMVIDHKREHVAMREMRKHLSWYVKGLPNASVLRHKINGVCTYAEAEEILSQWHAAQP